MIRKRENKSERQVKITDEACSALLAAANRNADKIALETQEQAKKIVNDAKLTFMTELGKLLGETAHAMNVEHNMTFKVYRVHEEERTWSRGST
jgi:hypothetical protein